MRWFVALLMLASGCGPEFIVATSSTATTDGATSGDGEEMSETDAWLVIGAIVLVSAASATVSATVDEDLFAYMRQHQSDVRRALASGDGPFPSDLCDQLGLPERELPRVSALLRSGRPWLDPHLARGPIDEDGLREFWGTLIALLAADPVTGPRVDAIRLLATRG